MVPVPGMTGGLCWAGIVLYLSLVMAKSHKLKPILRNSKTSAKKSSNKKIDVKKQYRRVIHNLNYQTGRLPYAHALAMPFESQPLQLPLMDQVVSSTVSKIHTSIHLDWSYYNANTSQLKIGQQLTYLFMNPLRSIVYYMPNSSGHSAKYQMVFESNGVNSSLFQTGTIATSMLSSSIFRINPVWLVDSYLGDNTHEHPHGNILYCGRAENKVGFWIDATESSPATCHAGSNGAAVNFDVQVYILDGDTFDAHKRVHCVNTTTADTTFTITKSGYYSIELITGDTMSFSFSFETSSSFFCHNCIPSIDTQLSGLLWSRINAGSLLFTNTSAEIAKNGNIIMAQLPCAQPWYNYITEYDALAAYPTATTLSYETGGYGFWKPKGIQDFEFVTQVTSSSGVVDSCYYPLTPAHDYLGFFVQCDNNGVTGNGTQATIVPCWHMEFSSSNQFHLLRPVKGNSNALTRDLQRLRTVAQFHENPLHISDLMNALKTTGRVALKYAPSLIKALTAVFPEYAGILQPAARLAATFV